MAEVEHAPPAKPGTACLGCRRRKLKCNREEETCSNCVKAGLPCVYPVPIVGAKRKRGPYKKDKPARERHLEDLVKYLEPQTTPSGSGIATATIVSQTKRPENRRSVHSRDKDADLAGVDRVDPVKSPEAKTSNSEDLVRDALVALTTSSVTEKEAKQSDKTQHTRPMPGELEMGVLGPRPSSMRVLEYWQIYTSRVDPLIKIIHCPSFLSALLLAINRPSSSGEATETLLFSIYFAAVSTCVPSEAQARFGESRDILLQRYGKIIETAVSDNYGLPQLESLQAIVQYMVFGPFAVGDASR